MCTCLKARHMNVWSYLTFDCVLSIEIYLQYATVKVDDAKRFYIQNIVYWAYSNFDAFN